MGMRLCRWQAGLTVLLLAALAGCREPKLVLTVDTGFFERRDALVTAPLDLGRPVRITELRHLSPAGENGKPVPFWYVPDSGTAGTLYWVLAGDTPSLEQQQYALSVAPAEPSAEPYGQADLSEHIRRETNLIPNPGFEEEMADPPERSTWKGSRSPTGWELNDYAWCYRQIPDLRSRCRLIDTCAHSGARSIVLSSEIRDIADDPDGKTKPTRISGFATGPTVPLQPGVTYYFRYYARISDLPNDEEQHLSVSASVNFLDADRKRVYPRQYAINRIQAAYTVNRHLPEEYRDRWVCVSAIKEAPPNARYGQVTIGMSLVGTVTLDDFVLREFHPGDPVKVTFDVRR